MRFRLGFALGVVLAALMCVGQARAGTWDDLAWMYRPSEIVQIHLTLDDDQRALLNVEGGDWVEDVGFSMEGSDGRSFGSAESPWEIDAKLKGSASFRFLDGKASFNLKLPSGSRPDGLKRMTLNNMVQDPSYLHETTAYEVFRQAGLPAPRTGYAQLWVNGEYFGLYLNLEKYNDQSLEHWFPSTQHLYEASRSGQDILRSGAALANDFEIDEGDEDDVSDLESLTAAVRTGDWSEIEGHLADPEATIRFLAAEWVVGHWDGYSWNRNNYYLHSDDDGLFTLLPSGTDQTFKNPYRSNFDLSMPLDSAVATWNAPVGGGPARGASALVDACIADPVCADRYVHEIESVRQTVDGLDIAAEVTERSANLSGLIQSDPRRESSLGAVSASQRAIVTFAGARDATARGLLRSHPLLMHAPTISSAPDEVSTTTVAEFGFDAGQDGSVGVTGFECRLDQGEFSACDSPVDYSRLAAGSHRFEVRAVNDGGIPSAASAFEWTVTPNRYALIVNEVGNGAGSVAVDREGPEYDEGSIVTLTATPDDGSTFEGWDGCDSVIGDDRCVVTMGAARTVEAEFAHIPLPGRVGSIRVPSARTIVRGGDVVVRARIDNVGEEPLTTTIWAMSSNRRVRAEEFHDVMIEPGEVEVVPIRVVATKRARGSAKITLTANGSKAVTLLAVKKPQRR